MIEYLELLHSLDDKLSQYDDNQLNQLYLRVFNTDDGLLILRDLANRCYVNIPTLNERTEGMRDTYLSIATRIDKAVTKKREDNDES